VIAYVCLCMFVWPASIGCASRENRVQDRRIKVILGFAPGYLGPFTRVADLPSRRSLRSVDTNRLVVPTSRLSTVGSRAFPVAGVHRSADME